MHCLSEKLISKILFSAKLHSSGIDFPYSTVVGTVTTINLGSAFEMPCGAPAAAAHWDQGWREQRGVVRVLPPRRLAATIITHTIVCPDVLLQNEKLMTAYVYM